MAVILALGTTETRSTDIVVAPGSNATVFLTDAAGPVVDALSMAEVQIKTAGGQYHTIGQLNESNGWAQVISGPGTFAVLRKTPAVAYAIEQT